MNFQQSGNTFLSVIIPTYQRADALSKCLILLSPESQTLEPDLYEIIVSDDAKDGLTKNMIAERFAWVTWVQGLSKGPAANRNNGTTHARGNWFIFIDDDCLPDKNLLLQYFQNIQQYPAIEAFEGAIRPERSMRKDEECPVNVTGNFFWTANVGISKKVFEQIGGFDENYPLAALEDVDIFYRLKEKTIVRFLPEAFVIHPVIPINIKKKVKTVPKLAQSWVYHVNKHQHIFGFSTKSDVFFQEVKRISFSLFSNLWRGNFKYALFLFYYLFVGNAYIFYFTFNQNMFQPAITLPAKA
ncbi:MAG: glycosyltransferase [Verrucomicrobia bacterium]|nr:glycosyltransferase [Cytophagales bacterium]